MLCKKSHASFRWANEYDGCDDVFGAIFTMDVMFWSWKRIAFTISSFSKKGEALVRREDMKRSSRIIWGEGLFGVVVRV